MESESGYFPSLLLINDYIIDLGKVITKFSFYRLKNVNKFASCEIEVLTNAKKYISKFESNMEEATFRVQATEPGSLTAYFRLIANFSDGIPLLIIGSKSLFYKLLNVDNTPEDMLEYFN